MNEGHPVLSRDEKITTPAQSPYPPLTQEPDVIKFVRLEAAHYHLAPEPEKYDPAHAKQVFDEVLDEAVEAEALGWDGFFCTEHHFDAWSLVPSPNILLAALAVKTRRMRLGTGVHIFPVHDPVRLAEEAGMLDVLSGGRLEFGIGRGNFEFELDRFTAPKDELVPRFDENLDVFAKAIHDNTFTYDGRWTKVRHPSTIYPRPLQTSLPIWIGTNTLGTVEKIGTLGHNLAGAAYPDGRERLERYMEAARKAGRMVGGANFLVTLPLFIAPTDAEAERLAADVAGRMAGLASRRVDPADGFRTAYWIDGGFFKTCVFGSPRTVCDKFKHILRGSGARRIIAIVRFAGASTEVARQTQRLLAEEVAPELRTFKVDS